MRQPRHSVRAFWWLCFCWCLLAGRPVVSSDPALLGGGEGPPPAFQLSGCPLVVVERIEGGFAIVECGEKFFAVPLSFWEVPPHEGDLLNPDLSPRPAAETAARKAYMQGVLQDLLEE